MSYTQNYKKELTVSGSVSGSTSCSCGNSVGYSKSYSQTVPINIGIHVDTRIFDGNTHTCANQVAGLTNSIVATKVANIAIKEQTSNKVSNAIIKGFFHVIGTEINLQVSQLTQRMTALVIELKDLAGAILKKEEQMETDYRRISARYSKIFGDLDSELRNRILALDKPLFDFVATLTQQNIRSTSTDMVSTVTVFGKESAMLQSKILVSKTKKSTLSTIGLFHGMLLEDKKLDKIIKERVLNENREGMLSLPVCYIQTSHQGYALNHEVHIPNNLIDLNKDKSKNSIMQQFLNPNLAWQQMPVEENSKINSFLEQELITSYGENTEHNNRIKDAIRKLAKLNEVSIIK